MNYDRKITIEQPIRIKDGFGAEVESWDAFAVVWANVNHKGGREGFYARQIVAEGIVVFKIRYTSGVTPLMRVNYDGVIYNITAVAEGGRREYLEIVTRTHDNTDD